MLYPNQIKLVENSEIKATVKTSYFKGDFYLIEANLNGKIIFFEHFEKLPIGAEIYLKIN